MSFPLQGLARRNNSAGKLLCSEMKCWQFVFVLGTLHAKPSFFTIKMKQQEGDLSWFSQKQHL